MVSQDYVESIRAVDFHRWTAAPYSQWCMLSSAASSNLPSVVLALLPHFFVTYYRGNAWDAARHPPSFPSCVMRFNIFIFFFFFLYIVTSSPGPERLNKPAQRRGRSHRVVLAAELEIEYLSLYSCSALNHRLQRSIISASDDLFASAVLLVFFCSFFF